MTRPPVPTVFLGSGAFAVPILEALAEHPAVEVVGVVTAPSRPSGRRGAVTPTPVHARSRELGIERVLTPERLREPAAIAEVASLDPGLLVLADYGRIVPPALLDPAHGALNVHPSLLPRHRGATPVPAAILAGDTRTGVTLMRMDAGLDTGPIIDQRELPLAGDETTQALERRLAELGAALLVADLAPWLEGALPARPQDDTEATLTRPLRREDGRLDPTEPASAIERRVRALQPWPGTFVETDLGRLAIWSAALDPAALDPGALGEPGTFDDAGLVVAHGRLRLLEVQPAGGRRMPWPAYVRGRPSIIGSRVRASG